MKWREIIISLFTKTREQPFRYSGHGCPEFLVRFNLLYLKYSPCLYRSCPDWQIAAHGCFSQSIVVGTVYATLGVDAVKEAVNELKASFLLCNRASVASVAKIVGQMPTLKVR
jgi:hypothetical protein